MWLFLFCRFGKPPITIASQNGIVTEAGMGNKSTEGKSTAVPMNELQRKIMPFGIALIGAWW
jgi:hypothetical protein